MRRFSIFVLLFLTSLTARETMAQKPEIDVMSFNIRYGTANDGPNHWTEREELVMCVIRHHAPDVIGLQEALRFQIDEIRTNFPGYGEIGEGRDGGKNFSIL
jgi:endonuclease/exonuclease/phosphatase family metal-dependent hydrolase